MLCIYGINFNIKFLKFIACAEYRSVYLYTIAQLGTELKGVFIEGVHL